MDLFVAKNYYKQRVSNLSFIILECRPPKRGRRA